VTEEFLKREVPLHHFGNRITSKVFLASGGPQQFKEDDVTKQLDFIERKAISKKFAEDRKQEED
jgi:hypothetical protein